MSDNKKFESLSDVELMSICIYGEARNQGLDGMLAVASVILNRAQNPSWWGSDIKSVILKKWQFSCLNENDPNRKTLENIASDFQDSLNRLNMLRHCYWVAKGLLEGFLTSNVGVATHYHTRSVSPSWKEKLQKVTQIGDHIFYV
ncbi:cell wall hydrolase [hot springs metagenome]|uniref:Cell wall hydrolase n=1 Tax=hot springs metagenome TaxID=433727 RepID=A0A5J4KYW3_9ZZZZ